MRRGGKKQEEGVQGVSEGGEEAGSVLRVGTMSGRGSPPLTCVCFPSPFSASVSFQAEQLQERTTSKKKKKKE